ncbi:hypothetical protein QE152_g21981 [Popillia japonica]|uniref:Uncharacterized protein n=1 Tax=Popillia japonica TaxID=7064 RepID=A0AAW1KK22_POPJA
MESEKKHFPIKKGSTVTIPVPALDRGKGTLRNLIGVIMEITKNNYYKIGTAEEILAQLYSRNQIGACKSKQLSVEEVPEERCTLRTASNLNLENNDLYHVIVEEDVTRCNSKCHKTLDYTNK